MAVEEHGGEGCPQGDYVTTPEGNCLALRVKAGDCLRTVRYKSPVQAYALGFCESADRIEVLAVHDAGEQACPSGVRHQYKRPPRTVCLSG